MEPRYERVAGYTFQFDFWKDLTVTDKPGLSRVDGVLDVGLSLELIVMPGRSDHQALAGKYFDAYRKISAAERELSAQQQVLGVPFEGVRFEELQEFGPQTSREVYVTKNGDDFVLLAYAINRALNPHEDEWRMNLCTTVAVGLTGGKRR